MSVAIVMVDGLLPVSKHEISYELIRDRGIAISLSVNTNIKCLDLIVRRESMMTVTIQMPSTVMRLIPNLHRKVIHHNALTTAITSIRIRNPDLYQRSKNLKLGKACLTLKEKVIMVPRDEE